MVRIVRFVLLLVMFSRLFAQEAKPQETDGFFSGTVAELAQDKVVVSRAILGTAPEKRTFVINSDTKVDGKLRAKIRVTVRYSPTDEGNVALAILVRDKTDKKK